MTIKFSIKNLITIGLVCVLIYILYQARQVVLIAIFGALVAYMLNPLVERLVIIGIPRIIATLMVLSIFGGVLILVGLWLIPEIYKSGVSFMNNFEGYTVWIQSQIVKVSKWIHIDLVNIDLYNYFTNWLKTSSSSIIGWLGGVANSVQYVVTVGTNIVLIPVIALFILADYPKMIGFLDEYMGSDRNKGVRKYIALSSSVMSSYFRGQFIVMAILCVLYSIALKIVGLNTAIFIGTMSGLLAIVPYLGFAIGIIAAVVMAAVQFQDIWHPIYVIIGYAVVQMLESFIITPRVMGNSLGLHPVATIILLLIGGAVFGLVGMIFVLPVATILFKIYKELLNKRARKVMNSSVEDKAEPDGSQ